MKVRVAMRTKCRVEASSLAADRWRPGARWSHSNTDGSSRQLRLFRENLLRAHTRGVANSTARRLGLAINRAARRNPRGYRFGGGGEIRLLGGRRLEGHGQSTLGDKSSSSSRSPALARRRCLPLAAQFIDPEFARVPAARLQLAVQRVEVIDFEGEGAGFTRLVVRLADQPDPHAVPRQDSG